MISLKLLKAASKPVIIARKFSIKPALHINRQLMRYPSYDDAFFGMASNIMRNLEREFDFMNRQFNKTYQVGSAIKNMFDMEDMMKDCIQVDEGGDRTFKLKLKVAGFQPEDIQVNTEGQNLMIQAKTEKNV